LYCGNDFGQVEERDLATGQRTGIRLDPQLGSVGDLVGVGAEGAELVGFAAGEAAYSRWQLDGSNLVARMRAPSGAAPIGYDPSGSYLLVKGRRGLWYDHGSRIYGKGRTAGVVQVATGELLGEVPAADGFAWVDDGRLVYWGRHGGGLLDVESEHIVDVPSLGPDTENVYADPHGANAWVTTVDGARTVVRELDLSIATDPAPFVEVAGAVYGVASTPQGRVLVTHESDEGVVTTAFDRETGAPLVSGMPGEIVTALSLTGRLVGADSAGDVTEFDVDTLRPIASLPGARTLPSTLQFDDSGSRLLVTAPDQTVQVYDMASRTRIGEAIPAAADNGMVEGWLRPDGAAVAVNGPFGVLEWTLEPKALAAAACELAGRNLTRAEWATYLPDQAYGRTCPDYPAGT